LHISSVSLAFCWLGQFSHQLFWTVDACPEYIPPSPTFNLPSTPLRVPSPPLIFQPLSCPPCHRRRRLPDAIITVMDEPCEIPDADIQDTPAEYGTDPVPEFELQLSPPVPPKSPESPKPLYNPQHHRSTSPSHSRSPTRESSRHGKQSSLPAQMLLSPSLKTQGKYKSKAGALPQIFTGVRGRRLSPSIFSPTSPSSRRGSNGSCGPPPSFGGLTIVQ
jgi:hypothetical protein